MFLVRWIRRLLALPLVWAGTAEAMFKQNASVPTLSLAWIVGRDGSVAAKAISQAYQLGGLSAGRDKARQFLQDKPAPQVAALAGSLAVEAGELAEGRAMLELARTLGPEPAGLVELLEFRLAMAAGPAETVAAARRLEGRRDLPTLLSRLVYGHLLWDELLAGKFEQARRRADFMLQIEDAGEAWMARWALAKRQGDSAACGNCLRRVQLPAADKLYFFCLGNVAIGCLDEARNALPSLTEANPALAQHVGQELASRGAA